MDSTNERHHPAPIALLTDFGTQDAYVGIMKGVILRLCPAAQLVDLTHAIAPQDVRQASFALWTAYRYFPPGTVFLAVVDPGVGSARKGVAMRAAKYTFVAPDNGLLSEVLRDTAASEIVEIAASVNPHGALSYTFHGRDLFAPAAARLACGEPLTSLGPRQDRLRLLDTPHFILAPGHSEGEIVYVDHYGNCVSSLGLFAWRENAMLELRPRTIADAAPRTLDAAHVQVEIGAHSFTGIRRTYADAAPGAAVPVIGSAGLLEIAVNGGSATAALDIGVGARIKIRHA